MVAPTQQDAHGPSKRAPSISQHNCSYIFPATDPEPVSQQRHSKLFPIFNYQYYTAHTIDHKWYVMP